MLAVRELIGKRRLWARWLQLSITNHWGPILLKNSCLIDGPFADLIPVLNGGLGDDGTEAGGASGSVL